jgi:hypothetical protein
MMPATDGISIAGMADEIAEKHLSPEAYKLLNETNLSLEGFVKMVQVFLCQSRKLKTYSSNKLPDEWEIVS